MPIGQSLIFRRLLKLHWLFWHPHQKLWNTKLFSITEVIFGRNYLSRTIQRALIGLDTILLWLRVVIRRIAKRGVRKLGQFDLSDRCFIYVDVGLHRKAKQIRQISDWFGKNNDVTVLGFEASEEHFVHAKEAVKGCVARIELFNVALVGPECLEKEVRLYKAGGHGAGDSLFSERGEQYEFVEARRLSEVISRQNFENAPIILRMNCEGAEYQILRDLCESGCLDRIQGFFGKWDDLSKIDPDLDKEFREFLRENRISRVVFCDRDWVSNLRLSAIKYEFVTILM